MTSLILGKCTVSGFLEQYRNKQTRAQYRSHLKQYFISIYSELENISPPQLVPELDRLSLQYFDDQRNLRKDLISYANQIQQYAPKTRLYKLTAIFARAHPLTLILDLYLPKYQWVGANIS